MLGCSWFETFNLLSFFTVLCELKWIEATFFDSPVIDAGVVAIGDGAFVLQVVQSGGLVLLETATEEFVANFIGDHHVENEVAPALASVTNGLREKREERRC